MSVPAPLWQAIARQAQRAPEALAIADAGGSFNFAELLAAANGWGRRLRARGCGAESLVALLWPRGCESVAAALGAMQAGAAYLPLDPAWPARRTASVLADSAARFLITAPELASALPNCPCSVLVPEEGEGVAKTSFAASTAAEDSALDALAYVIYTSGSTGVPKGVEITRANLANLLAWHLRAFGITSADRAAVAAGPAFDASVWEVWPYLTVGASLHIAGAAVVRDPEAFRDWLLAERITIAFAPTPLAEQLLRLPWPASASLRLLLTGADTLRLYPPAGLPFTLVNNYGPTECTVVATSQVVPAARGETASLPAIGFPIDGVSVYLLDADGRPVPPGERGEVYIGGAGVGRGYRGRPQETAARFVPDPFAARPGGRLFRTGDFARCRPDGSLDFLGRDEHMIKIRGYRIDAEEVAAVLLGHPAISGSVVIAAPTPAGEPELIAYVVAPAALRAVDLRAFLAARLPDYMVPAKFVGLCELPVTENGKLNRAALPLPCPANLLPDGGNGQPATPLEARLLALVRELLGLATVGSGDNFFDLGGHSLLGAQLAARVRDDFGVRLPLRDIFDHPTVSELAVLVQRSPADVASGGQAGAPPAPEAR